MDKQTAYAQGLMAATASIRSLRAMLPDDVWGDDPDRDEKEELERFDRILAELEDGPIPFSR